MADDKAEVQGEAAVGCTLGVIHFAEAVLYMLPPGLSLGAPAEPPPEPPLEFPPPAYNIVLTVTAEGK